MGRIRSTTTRSDEATVAQRTNGSAQVVVQIVGSRRVETEPRERGQTTDQQRDEAQVRNGYGQSQPAIDDQQAQAAGHEQHADTARRGQTGHGPAAVVAATIRYTIACRNDAAS